MEHDVSAPTILKRAGDSADYMPAREGAVRTPSEEIVDVVDEDDAVVGSSTVGECLAKGLLHRAVAVLVIRSSGEFVIQRRSRKDRWHPGLWTISCTGHVRAGESYDEAAGRELHEELGLAAEPERAGKYLLPPLESDGLTEREWVAFYLARTDSPCTIDPVELDSAEEFDEGGLLVLLEGGTMTPDAVIILRDYLKRKPRNS